MKRIFALIAFAIVCSASFAQSIKEHYIYDSDTLIYGEDSLEIFKVENLGDKVNSVHVESGPRISPDGKQLYFFRVNHPKNVAHTRDIWVSNYNESDSTWGAAKHMGSPLNNHGDNSVHWISKDGKKMLVHNEYLKNGTTQNGLSMTEKLKDGTWTMPEALKVKHYKNDEVCSFYMNDDATVLIMAIHYKDSYGHQDLYVSFREDNKGIHWSAPVNMGPRINTAGSEATAFLAADGITMYFSTNGKKGGVGGFDIYKTTRLDSTWTNWSKPVNMGKPYNTPDDEFYFSIPDKSDYVYLSHHFATHDSTEHSDIVRIKLKPAPMLELYGTVFDDFSKEPIEAKIKFRRISDNDIYGDQTSSIDSGYNVKLPVHHIYEYTVEAPGYETLVKRLDISDLAREAKRKMDIYLPREPALVLSGLVYDKKTKKPIGGHVIIKNKETGEVVYDKVVAKDEKYNVTLPAGVQYEMSVENKPDYFTYTDFLDLRNLKVHKEEKKDVYLGPIRDAFEIEDIYFETAKATLLPKSYQSLDKLISALKHHPNITVEISGHTDWEGSDTYNQDLSKRRAQSVVKYLSENSIDVSQLVAEGYGETKPVATNKTKEGRAKNRRVEFKVLEIR